MQIPGTHPEGLAQEIRTQGLPTTQVMLSVVPTTLGDIISKLKASWLLGPGRAQVISGMRDRDTQMDKVPLISLC